MSREKQLFKNTMIYLIGNFGSKFLGFLLLPFYTHYLSVEGYGFFDLIMTSVQLITPLLTFQINDGLYRFLLDANDLGEQKSVISQSFLVVLKNMIIFNLIYILVSFFIDCDYKLLILIQLNTGIISGMWMQTARGLRKNVDYSISGVLTTLITLVTNIVLIVVFGMKVKGLIISNIVAALFVIVYLEHKLKISSYINFQNNDKSFKTKLVLYSIPLIPNVLNWWFMNVSDRYILNCFKGIEANGIYAVANKFSSILIMVNSIFYLAWQESAIIEYEAKDRNQFYSKTFNSLMILQFSLVILLLPFTKASIKYIVDPTFYCAWKYIPYLYFGAIFSSFSSFYGTGYQSSKETKGAFITSILGALVNVVLNLSLVPFIGIQGASLSTMLAFLIVWVSRVLAMKKYFVIEIDKTVLFVLTLLSVLFTILYFISTPILSVLLMIVGVVLFVFLNKKLICNGLLYIKRFFIENNETL
jgi:O-antigen/teichoic acid export membrane protein